MFSLFVAISKSELGHKRRHFGDVRKQFGPGDASEVVTVN